MNGKLSKIFHSSNRKRREFAAAAANFGEAYPGAFVLIADPDTDVIIMQYRGIQVPVRYVHPVTGKRMNIVRNALMYRKVQKSIDQFLLAVDSGLFNIAKAVYNKRKTGLVGSVLHSVGIGKEERFEKDETGGVPSPLAPLNVAEEEDSNESGE